MTMRGAQFDFKAAVITPAFDAALDTIASVLVEAAAYILNICIGKVINKMPAFREVSKSGIEPFQVGKGVAHSSVAGC